MTANRRTTVLIVSAVVFTMLLGGIAFAQQAAPAPQAMETTTPGTSGIAVKSGPVTMADIDNALASGPVFIEFESKTCTYCKEQRPISDALAADYQGKVTFFFADVAESRDLAKYFQVSGVPQINVIAQKADGGYTYVGKDGSTSSSIAGSKFLGLTQSDTLKTALDAAVRMRGQ
ncbi:thioredoxin family protein [Methanocella arvoryzae]|uniref:Thioredoxin-like protein n=1 Tax=Methanocella arvoryzae (strain DSM 22066 / NBRC 105507 / MRE50) TaxID=351160 RepID=Q0W8S3_METAR|nr:thioredoxin family protein [Methanocella arvoryzae]CAJ35220.1 thioredoxin-like protein [Methanocella arvoryzae MRE50]